MFERKIAYKIVEVEKEIKLEPMTPELADQLKTLQHNPAFVWLLNKLAHQKALLTRTLINERQETVADSEFLKSGIAWTGWLDAQIRDAIAYGKRQSAPREVYEDEQRAFDEVARQLEIVG